jgi:hypothetical protein
MKVIRTLFLFTIGIGLLTLGGFFFPYSELALPSALAGVTSIGVAIF